MRYVRLAVGLFILMVSHHAGAAAFSGSYEQKITVNGIEVARFKVHALNENVRTELLSGEQPEVVLKNDQGTFRYLPSQNMALKLPDVEQPRNLLDDLDDYMAFLEQNEGRQVGTENVGGAETHVYEFKDPMTQEKAKAWVLPEQKFPAKIEVQAPEGVITIELSEIQTGTPVDAGVFELPAGTRIVELEKMLQALPGTEPQDIMPVGPAVDAESEAAAPQQ